MNRITGIYSQLFEVDAARYVKNPPTIQIVELSRSEMILLSYVTIIKSRFCLYLLFNRAVKRHGKEDLLSSHSMTLLLTNTLSGGVNVLIVTMFFFVIDLMPFMLYQDQKMALFMPGQ